MGFFTRPMFLDLIATTLAGVALLGCTISSAGAQPSEPPQPGPGAPPVGGPPGGPGFGRGFQADFGERLAANLGLPVDTVRNALQQVQPEMPTPSLGQPPMPPDQSGGFRPGGPGGPGEFRGPGGPPPGSDGPGDFPGRPGGPPPGSDGPGDFLGRPGGPGVAGGPPLDGLASRLADVLSMPEETVRAALQQTFQEMRPDRPAGQPLPQVPAAP